QQQQQHAPPAAELAALSPSDRDLLQRPEGQAIIRGLKSGEITVQNVMQQLSNPGLQSRHREMLLTILRLHHARQVHAPCPRPTSPHAHLAPRPTPHAPRHD
ncbi:hypothetical protein RR48_05380, partial [Papilio machaon]